MANQERRRRTKAQIAQLRRQMYEVLEQDHPQSVRHVFYRMTDPRLPEPVEKSEAGYTTVQRQLVTMRREGMIPYGWLTDATRWGHFIETYGNATDALEQAARFYRRDIWARQPVYVEVWCESRSIAGIIHEETTRYAVPLYPSGGFASLSLIHSAAEYIRATANNRPVHILYIVDYDSAGVLIDKKIEEGLKEHIDDIDLTFDRIAITKHQIELMRLPTKPTKDRRGGFDDDTVEAEAMPAAEMRRLVRTAIETLIDDRELAVVQEAEESERQVIQMFAQRAEEAAL